MKSASRRGFTLIELLLVIGIIAILASIVIVAINPTRQLGSARNAQRRSDVNTIINALYQYSIDNQGKFPWTTQPSSDTQICKSAAGMTCAGMVNLSALSPNYIVAVPSDPQAPAAGEGSNYWVKEDVNGRLTVTASGTEIDATDISVTR